MTFSLLIRDEASGTLAGAAATGSLCVGGWVLRGRLGAGMSASQGAAPSTFWGDSALDLMATGAGAGTALQAVTEPDPNRDWRQLALLDPRGGTAAHSGSANSPVCTHRTGPGRVASGNLLAGEATLERLMATYETAPGTIAARLIAALAAAQAEGGDRRGLKSAALLVLHPDAPPLTLRVDLAEDPVSSLASLHAAASGGDYARWTRAVPVASDPYRADAAIIRADGDDPGTD